MSEEQIISNMRKFRDAVESRDVEKTLAFFTDDAEWQTPEGTFKGKEQLKRYISWNMKMSPEFKMVDSGINIVVKGNIGIYEHIISGTVEGSKWATPALCIYELADDKIKGIRTVYDRLAIAKQVSKGTIAKMSVNGIIKNMEKGLH
jgi:ketosteroid isomerase-like protein